MFHVNPKNPDCPLFSFVISDECEVESYFHVVPLNRVELLHRAIVSQSRCVRCVVRVVSFALSRSMPIWGLLKYFP